MEITFKKDGIEVNGEFISLITINESCNNARINSENLVLLTMSWNGRSGSVTEVRALPLESVKTIKEMLLNKKVYFGEIWGKHSEVYGDMCKDTFSIEKDKNKVNDFLCKYPDRVDYDYSFIETFINNYEDGQYDMDEEINQKFLDKLKDLINNE